MTAPPTPPALAERVLRAAIRDPDDPARVVDEPALRERVAQERVLPDFKLTSASAQAWIEAGFRHAGGDLW